MQKGKGCAVRQIAGLIKSVETRQNSNIIDMALY